MSPNQLRTDIGSGSDQSWQDYRKKKKIKDECVALREDFERIRDTAKWGRSFAIEQLKSVKKSAKLMAGRISPAIHALETTDDESFKRIISALCEADSAYLFR